MDSAFKTRWVVLFPFILVSIFCGLLTQMHIGTIPVPTCGIYDQIHIWSTTINEFFQNNTIAANFVLITTSFFYDSSIFFIMGRTLYKHSFSPFLALVFFFLLRQGMQLLVALPIPEGLVWHYPGFPSFFVYYGISNDLYFSAHTGVSLIASLELYAIGKTWSKAAAIALFSYMVLAVLLLRFHYTMDVYTAILTVCLTRYLSNRLAPRMDDYFERLKTPKGKCL